MKIEIITICILNGIKCQKESQPAKTRLWQKSCHNHFFRMNSVPKGASSEISFIITYDLPIILPTFTSYRFRLS